MATKVLTYEGLQELVSKLKTLIGTKADSSAIPTKVSQLTNDSGYVTTDTNTTYGLSISDHTVSLVEGGSTKSVTVPDNNTTYNDVSANGSASGLMTVSDKKKLDGIATGATKITVDSALSSTSTNPVQNKVINTALAGKVSTVSGKGLSTNDYTDEEKNKLAALATDGEANTIESISKNGTALTIDSKKNVNITVPTKTSDLTNDSNYVSDSSYVHTDMNFTSALKTKLDGIATGATKITVDSALSSTSTNPLQNKAINTALGNKVDKVSGKGLSTNDLTDALVSKINGAVQSSSVGTANGVASLDNNGQVPSSQLPSYVDDVIEGYLYNSKFYKESSHTTQITGETGKIYVDMSTNKTYRWSGSAFVEISASLALGETSSTAYRGDRGKIAYEHSLITSGNPHNVTKSDIGLGSVENKSSATIRGELTSSDVTTALGFTPQAASSGKGLSTNDYTTAEKNKLSGIASGAEVNVQSDWSVTDSSSDAYIKNKPSIPTKTSDLTNDSDFVSDASYVHTDVNFTSALKTKLDGIATGATKTTIDTVLSSSSTNPVQNKVINTALAGKVDAVSGKGLSTNDFTDALLTKLNGIAAGATSVTVDSALSSTSTNPLQNKAINTALGNKVDKVSGKGLSTNDYTTDEKTKLSGIASGAQANVIESVKVNGTALTVSSKAVNVTVPTKTSDLTNDSDFVSDSDYVHTDVNFTSTLKSKLDGIASGAQANVIESVKVNGTALTVSSKAVNITAVTGVKGSSESAYRTGQVNITKANIGLGNVDNTADSAKSVASATKATQDSAGQQINTTYIKSVVADGDNIIVTKGNGTTSTVSIPEAGEVVTFYLTDRNGNKITDRSGNYITARRAIGSYATSTKPGLMSAEDYTRVRTNESNISSIQSTLATKAPLESPSFTGTPTAPTAVSGSDDSQIANTEFVTSAIASYTNSCSRVELQTVTGNGTFGSSNPSSVTFSFAPRILFLIGSISGGYIGSHTSQFFNTSQYLGVYRSDYTANLVSKWALCYQFCDASIIETSYSAHLWLGNVQIAMTEDQYSSISANPNVQVKKSSDGKTFTWYANRNGASTSLFIDDVLKAMQLNTNGMVSYILAIE